MLNIRLKTRIIEKGISQIELSRQLGIDDGHLSNIIRGWKKAPDDLKQRIAAALGSDTNWLFGDSVGDSHE